MEKFPLGPLRYNSFTTMAEADGTGFNVANFTSPVNTLLNRRNIWVPPPHHSTFIPAKRLSLSKAEDNCVTVCSKDALQSTPCNQPVTHRVQNVLTPFESLTSKMRVPRYVFYPNEALRGVQTFKTRCGSTYANYSDRDQRSDSNFFSQLPSGTAASNLVTDLRASTFNVEAPFVPFFDAKPSLVMPWQCAPHVIPESECIREWPNEVSVHNSILPSTLPKATPVVYSFQDASQVGGSVSYQASMPFVPGVTVPQYPDAQYMFRAANLFMVPKQVSSQETSPFFEETPPKRIRLPRDEDKGITQTNHKTVGTKEPQTTCKRFTKNKGSKSHQCSFCCKKYTRHSALKVHMRIHTGEKPYSCIVCSRTFTQAGGLESHMRSHTGEKPYKCDFCDRRFSHSNAAKNHRRTHTGEKPYKCEYEGCLQRFADQSTLKKHLRIHTGEKPFQCPHCWRKFTQVGNKNKHIQCRHSEVMQK